MINTPSMHHRKHVSKARVYKHANTRSTQVCKNAYTPSTQARKHVSTQARKHANTQTRQAREHASTQTRQARDLADSQRLESIQYNAALAKTGTVRGSSRENFCQELGLESFCDFFQLTKNQSPNYLFDKIRIARIA